MIKTFLINLDKNPERLVESARQLNALGVSFERIAAIYGKDLGEDEKRRSVNAFRWWCAKGRKVRDGEIGCALSHLSVYRKMIDENIDVACILEDDNRYRDTFASVVQQAEKLMDVTRPQVVLLSNCSRDRATMDSVHIVPTKNEQWTSSYLITRRAAKAILAANYPLHVPADGWGRWAKRGLIELYHCFPTVAVQDGNQFVAFGIPLTVAHANKDSDIEAGAVLRVSELPLHLKAVHKIKRVIGTVIDVCLPLREAE